MNQIIINTLLLIAFNVIKVTVHYVMKFSTFHLKSKVAIYFTVTVNKAIVFLMSNKLH